MQEPSSKLIEISMYGTLFNFKPHPLDKDLIMSIGNDYDLSIWNVAKGELVQKIEGSKNSLTDATTTRNFELFALASNDGIVTVTNTIRSTQVNIKEHSETPTIVPLSVKFYEGPDYTYLVVGTSSKLILVFKVVVLDEIKLEKIQEIEVQSNELVAWPTVLDVNDQYLLVFQKGQINVWDMNQQNQFEYLENIKISTIDSQILSHDMFKQGEQHFLLGDAGFGFTLVKMELKDFKILFHLKMSSAVLKVQALTRGDALLFACGTLDPGILLVDSTGKTVKLVENRAAPFLFCIDSRKVIYRSSTVTRMAHIDNIDDLIQ